MSISPIDMYVTFDEPVPYKDLEFFPVSMRDYFIFGYLSSCLLLEKDSVPDPKVISMTYLEYLFSITDDDNKLISKLDGLLRYVLGKKNDTDFKIIYKREENGRPLFIINNKEYNSDDFDKIRQIISEQNAINLPDESIQKSVRDAIEEARRYKEKLNNTKAAGLEDQMVALSVYTGWPLKDIYNLSIRKFVKAIKRANHLLYQKIYLQSSLSGFVTFKDKSILSGWLSDIDEKDRYDDVTIDLEVLKGKANFSNAKENK